jgi:hypothetical protein
MGFENATRTYNVTTTQKTVDLKRIFGAEEVVIINTDEDDGVFYAQNPNATSVLTSEVDLIVMGVTDNEYTVADSSSCFVGDEIEVITAAGVTVNAKVIAVTSTSITIDSIIGFTPAYDDTLRLLCFKLPNGVQVKSDKYPNGFLIKHKDNVDTGAFQVTFITMNKLKNVSPFFFKA